MIDEVKQLMEFLKDMPHFVLWALAGLLFYKVVYVGSVFGLIRLLILKGYEAYTFKASAPRTLEYKIADHFIVHDGTFDRFITLLHSMQSDATGRIHKDNVDFWIAAIREKKEREKQEREGT